MLEPRLTRRRAPLARALAALVACIVCICTWSAASAQSEQQGFSLDQFQPTPPGDRFFAVPSAEAQGHARLKLMLLGEYAREPLVLVRQVDGQDDEEIGAVVSDQLFVHVGAGLALWNRVNLSLDFPIALLNSGDDTTVGADTFTAPTGASAGDLRAGLRLRLLGAGPFQVALGGYVWFPTGEAESFTGAGSVRGMPHLVVSGKAGAFVYAVHGGVLLGPEATFAATTVGHQFVFGAAAGVLAVRDRLQIGPELYGNTVVVGEDDLKSETTNAELLFGMKFRAGPMVLGAGAGPGLTRGIGTPSVRAVASVAYAPIDEDKDHDGILDVDDACPLVPGVRSDDPAKNGCPEPISDRDKDGIVDAEDACPDDPGPQSESPETNGCPDRDRDGIVDKLDACPAVKGIRTDDPKTNGCPPDRDRDGILDAADACPDVPGVKSEDPKKNGCPPDRDGDGIADDKDACPDVPGVASPDPAKNGCPADTDGDGITDDKDACPKEKGAPDPDPKKNGCPKVFVTDTNIVIREQVQFRTGSDVILPESDELLTNVSKVLVDHPEITKVLVEGHTDNKGGKAYNQGLSNRRAASVKKWLTTRGKVDGKRLESKGFGMDNPIDTNDTEEGRQKNRRVEFKIVEQSKPGGAAQPAPAPAAAPPPAPGAPTPVPPAPGGAAPTPVPPPGGAAATPPAAAPPPKPILPRKKP